ncbi:hypothetical protein [Streptomyces sp. NPDC058653]|uniref:hypothetical protein n=1 Tax=Streptomyces sp. NPDC058653 TaxID=3346576 RepID=UPI003663BF10
MDSAQPADGDLLDRLRQHAARRGMSVQDHVVGTLTRDDFNERFRASVDETERFYGAAQDPLPTRGAGARTGRQVRPSAGIA